MSVSRELEEALAQAGVGFAPGDLAWERVMIVRNAEALPPFVPSPTGFDGQGFKLLLLDAAGRAVFFVRCAWREDRDFARECSLLHRLMQDRRCASWLPDFRVGTSMHLRILASRYTGPTTFSRRMRGYGPDRWIQAVSGVLDVSASVMKVAEDIGSEWVGTGALADIPSVAQARFDVLERTPGLGLSLDVLREAVSALAGVRPCLQHGDMWPDNVVWWGGRWQLLDFAECGHAWSPLYDAFHMLSTGPAGSMACPWYALEDAPPDAWGRARYRLLEALGSRHGMGAAQVGAALVYYLVHLLAYRLRPGISGTYSKPILAELQRVDRFLRSGRRVDQ